MHDCMQYCISTSSLPGLPETNKSDGTHDMDQQWRLCSKLWLECEGKPVIGDGRMEMLRSIHRNGSIKLAAEETGISYRRMRGAIHEMEVTIGYPLVNIQRGGGGGGGARLTQAAHKLIETFKQLSAGFQRKADERFHKLSDFFSPSNGKKCHSIQNGDNDHETL